MPTAFTALTSTLNDGDADSRVSVTSNVTCVPTTSTCSYPAPSEPFNETRYEVGALNALPLPEGGFQLTFNVFRPPVACSCVGFPGSASGVPETLLE